MAGGAQAAGVPLQQQFVVAAVPQPSMAQQPVMSQALVYAQPDSIAEQQARADKSTLYL